MRMFIDESGALGTRTKYFVVSGIIVDSPDNKLDKLALDLLDLLKERNQKYHHLTEIKASTLEVPDKVFAVNYLIQNVMPLGIVYVYISKDNKFKEWLEKKINKRKTVVYLDRRLIDVTLRINPYITEVVIDKNHYIKGGERDIKEYFKSKNVKVSFEKSDKRGGLQFADIVANAIFIDKEPDKRIKDPYTMLQPYILHEELVQWKLIKNFRL